MKLLQGWDVMKNWLRGLQPLTYKSSPRQCRLELRRSIPDFILATIAWAGLHTWRLLDVPWLQWRSSADIVLVTWTVFKFSMNKILERLQLKSCILLKSAPCSTFFHNVDGLNFGHTTSFIEFCIFLQSLNACVPLGTAHQATSKLLNDNTWLSAVVLMTSA